MHDEEEVELEEIVDGLNEKEADEPEKESLEQSSDPTMHTDEPHS